MRSAAGLFGILCSALLLGAGAPGATVYVNRVVVAPPGTVTVGALVRAAGPLSPEAQQVLSRGATTLGDSLQYLPVSQYQDQLDAAFGSDAILVGSWSMIVARGTSAEGQGYLLDRLADYLISQGLVADGRVDMSFTLTSSMGGAPRDGTPSFQLLRTARGAQVSFMLTASDGSFVAGRVTIAAPAAADTASTVRGSSSVSVVFRKGPITVEMPGRTLAGASVGDTVSVYVPDSQKSFSGRLVSEKAVQVDLP